MRPLLSIRGVETYYGNIRALKGVDLDVYEGEIVTLIGSNGAGKTTLMMTVCGEPRARSGQIVFDGRNITKLSTHEIMRLSIAQSPEGRRIFPRMTVYENLLMGALLAPQDGAASQDDLAMVFELFPILKSRQAQRRRTADAGHRARSYGAAEASSSRRAVARPRAADRKADIQRDPQSERKARADGLSGGAERLSRAKARPSRLCHGERKDYLVRECGRSSEA